MLSRERDRKIEEKLICLGAALPLCLCIFRLAGRDASLVYNLSSLSSSLNSFAAGKGFVDLWPAQLPDQKTCGGISKTLPGHRQAVGRCTDVRRHRSPRRRRVSCVPVSQARSDQGRTVLFIINETRISSREVDSPAQQANQQSRRKLNFTSHHSPTFRCKKNEQVSTPLEQGEVRTGQPDGINTLNYHVYRGQHAWLKDNYCCIKKTNSSIMLGMIWKRQKNRRGLAWAEYPRQGQIVTTTGEG